MNKKMLKIISLIIIIISIIGCIYFIINDKKQIYSTTYNFEFGSRKVKVYSNGDVYDDLEVEEPNHKENYNFVTKLSNKQLKELNKKIDKKLSNKEISSYLIKEVYGVTKFDKMGQY